MLARFRGRRPSPGLVVATVALVAALGGTAVALPGKNRVDKNDLQKNVVRSKNIKRNAVRPKHIRRNAVRPKQLNRNAVRGQHVQDDALTGADINESSLGTVPSAQSATSADSVAGRQPFFLRLSFGDASIIAQNGAVSLTAVCDQDGGNDRIRILAATTQDGAILKSNDDDLLGPGVNEFLDTATAPDDREFVNESDTTGDVSALFEIDGGYVVGPDGNMITLEKEGLLLAVNYLGADCVLAGVANTLSG